jgi:integrase/recombinase XerD
LRTVYTLFREMLLQCGIPHAGRGKGPRIHDYRQNAEAGKMPHDVI